LLAALQLAGCTYWNPQPIGPREVFANPDVRHVRITRSNGQQIEARIAEIRGDSLYGTRGSSGPLTCERAAASCSLQLPISEVGFVEVRSFSAIKTAALVIVPVGVIAVALAAGSCSRGPSSGPC
jgi:hypothetical protein